MQILSLSPLLFSLTVLAMVAAGSTSAQAQSQSTTPPAPPSPPELIIDQVKKAVAFLQGTYQAVQNRTVDGVQTQVVVPQNLAGTGFFIFVADPRFGPQSGITYLVTNKHLIREPGPSGALGAGPYLKSILARVNTIQPNPDGSQYALFPLTVLDDSGSLSWFIDRDDDTVDLAITPVQLNREIIDYKTIQSELFATKTILQKEHVNENDEILFAGLFAWSPGAKKNYPIVRHGKLARLAEERIPLDRTNPTKTVEVHLADVMSFGGNSGSPVFLRLGGVREGSTTASFGFSYYLLGVMQGFFPEGVDFAIEVAELKGSTAQNSGIAAVVPSDKILKLLESPRSKSYVERVLAEVMSSKGNFTEAEQSYRKAIEILQVSDPQHSDLAACLEAYARFLHGRNRAGEAKPLEDQAKQIRSDVQPDRMNPKI
jgi:Tetratricopeptide repeat